jgi:dihydroorotate dehydrogenase (NAD+) catalytic subunit
MNLKTKIANIEFKNPLWVASGTFGNGEEFSDFLDLNQLGAIVAKTITLEKREGNPPPRIIETSSGLLNSIGLENGGVKNFLQEGYPFLKGIDTQAVISIAGSTADEIEKCIEILNEESSINIIEINLSCPNVQHKGAKKKLLSQDPEDTESIIKAARAKTKKAIIAKLTPNVTDITEIAKAAEAAGADAISLVNTFLGMAIDINTQKPILGNVVGGLSGPAIKPLALKAVWDTYKSVQVPIIGMGGIMTGGDVVEFMLAGATAVQIGTANLVDPTAYQNIYKDFTQYLEKQKIKDVKDLIGTLKS